MLRMLLNIFDIMVIIGDPLKVMTYFLFYTVFEKVYKTITL